MYQRSSGKFYRKASCRSKVVHDQNWNLRPRSEEDQNWNLRPRKIRRACSAAQSREDEGTAEGLCGMFLLSALSLNY
ncbi:hypothetical protein LXL04_008439 [Taraxacum kok-saghyz]